MADGDEEQKVEAAPAAPAETKEAPNSKGDQFGMEALKLKAKKAFEALKKSGDAWYEKAAGFFTAFFEDVELTEDKEKAAKKEIATKAAAVLSTTASKDIAKGLSTAFVEHDEEGKPKEEAPDVVTDILTVATETEKLVDADRAKAGKAKPNETVAALSMITDKVDPKNNPDKDPLDAADKKLAYCYGVRLIVELKKAYPDKGDFVTALNEFDKATEKAPVGFHTLKTDEFKCLFRLDKIPVIEIVEPFSFYSTFSPVLDKIGVGASDVGGFIKETLFGDFKEKLKAGEVPDLLKEYAAKLFPKTFEKDPAKVDEALKVIAQIAKQKEEGVDFPTNQQFADIAFAINDEDLLDLSNTFA